MTSTSTMFSDRTLPWMKVGTVIDRQVTAAEASELGGLNFDVEPRPAGYLNDTGTWVNVPGRVCLVRQDTQAVFGYATDEYMPVHYSEAFEFMDEINPKYVAAGALRGGRQGFMVVELPDVNRIDLKLRGISDPHQLYVILRTSQDMSRGVEISLVTLRERCMNQLSLRSFTHGAIQSWAIRHTRNVFNKMSEAQRVIRSADGYANEFEQVAMRLADIDVPVLEVPDILQSVLPDRPRRTEQIEVITDAFMNSNTGGFPETGWGLVNAIDEYFEFLRPSRGRTEESRFTDGLDGSAHRYVNRAAQLLLSGH